MLLINEGTNVKRKTSSIGTLLLDILMLHRQVSLHKINEK